MIHFLTGIDGRAREPSRPTVAKFNVRPGVDRYIVIGTDYGHIHTTGGDVRTWASYSGARRFAREYGKTRGLP